MASETISLKFLAELGDLKRQLGQMEGIGDKEAKKLVKSLERQYKRATKIQKREAEQWQRAVSAAVGNMAAFLARDLTAAIGQAVQASADLRNELNDLSGMTGISAETLGGLRVAVRASGGEISEVSRGLSAFSQRLLQASRGSGAAAEALAALGVDSEAARAGLTDADGAFRDVLARLKAVPDAGERAALAMELFGRSGQRMVQVLSAADLDTFVAAAEEFAVDVGPEASRAAAEWQVNMSRLQDVLHRTTGDVLDFFDASSRVREFSIGLVFLREVVGETFGILLGNLKAALEAWGAFSMGNLQAAADMLSTQRSLAGSWDDIIDRASAAAQRFADQSAAMSGAAMAGREYAGAMDEAADAGERTARASEVAGNAITQLAAVQRDARSDTLSALDQVNLAYDQRLARIFEIVQATGDLASAQSALAEVEARRLRDVQALEAEIAADAAEAVSGLEKLSASIADAIAEHAREMEQAMVDVASSAAISAATAGQVFARLAVQRAQDQEKVSAKEKKAALDAFYIGQTLAVAEVTFQWAAAFAAMTAALAPVLAVGAPAAAAAVTGPGLAASIAEIMATSPPEFPAGGMVSPDHQVIAARPTEAVLTDRGVAAVGGATGVDQLNRGQPVAQTIQILLDRRVIAHAVASATTVARPVLDGLAGRAPVYGGA